MWYDNEITKLLNIEYPIVQAGMAGGITTPELVATVSNSGCLGTIGAGYMTAEQLRENIRETKKLTNKPFGANLFIPECPEIIEAEINKTNELLKPIRQALNLSPVSQVEMPNDLIFEEQIKVIIEENVPVCSFTFGLPAKEIVEKLKRNNITLIGTATTVREAIANEKFGMDIVVVQGSEAGGHRGTFLSPFEEAMIGTMSLVPQTVDHINIPVVAAGGIMDGRGIISALVLGAQAVQMGTAFVTSLESGAKRQHKEAILHSKEDELTITSAFSGKPARGILNDFTTEMAKHENELPKYPIQNNLTQPIRSEAAKQNCPEWMSLWCGQNPRMSKQQSASNIISDVLLQVDQIVESKLKKW